jgi:hypothetical protein
MDIHDSGDWSERVSLRPTFLPVSADNVAARSGEFRASEGGTAASGLMLVVAAERLRKYEGPPSGESGPPGEPNDLKLPVY